MVKDMDIPNYENWFEAAYGAGGGATRAKTYGARLDQNDVNFENKFVGLAQQNGDILTQSTNASPLADVAVKWGMVDSVKQSLDVYVATWRPAEGADPSTTIPIGFFMFIEGKFRWNSLVVVSGGEPPPPVSPPESPAQTSDSSGSGTIATGDSRPSRPGVGGVGYPSCAYCPSPQRTDQALKEKLQGTIVLIATIQADGHATDIKIVGGSNMGLAESAIAAVKYWRFNPATGPDGKPVAVTTQIEMTFRAY
jgi:TonB family protein